MIILRFQLKKLNLYFSKRPNWHIFINQYKYNITFAIHLQYNGDI